MVGSDGRIAAIGADEDVPQPDDARERAYPGCVLMPGLINTHTHLELHHVTANPPGDDFAAWIGSVRRRKERMNPEAFLEAARRGVQDTWRWGITTVADTGTSGATVHALTELEGQGVYYQEAIAPDAADADEAFAQVRERVVELGKAAGDRVRLGVSPHAPYTVSERLYRMVVGFARAEGLPLAGHVAESRAESDFVISGAGPFADLWRARSIGLPDHRRSAVSFAADQHLLGEDMLAIHVVQVDEEDIELMVDHDVAVAVCPRSNRRHGHGDPPLRRLLDAGLRVGLGTDSLLSVESLDLLAEARAAQALAAIDAERALELVTIEAALALGVADVTGSLVPGRRADLCIVDVSAVEGAGVKAVLSPEARVVGTIVGGRDVFDAAVVVGV